MTVVDREKAGEGDEITWIVIYREKNANHPRVCETIIDEIIDRIQEL